MMTSQYPNAIDNIPPAPDGYISVNAAISAINNIENELGILPSGPYPTVRVRLDVLESRINNPNSSSGSGEFITIGGTGVFVIAGDGDPNTTYPIANPGSLFLREDGYNIQGLYSMRTDGTWHQIDTDPWTAAGDLSGSIYSQEVIGIDGYLLPNISIGNLNWTGSAWAFTPAPTSLPPSGPAGAGGEGDLTGSYPNPTLANVIGPTTTTGSSTTVPVITVNRKGQVIGLTSANIAFPTTLPPDGYAGGDLTGSYPNPTLIPVGTAGTYGDATHYPVITTDSKGRVTSVTTQVSAGGFTAGGDLSGSATSQKVIGLDGYVLPTVSSSDPGYLNWNGSSWSLNTISVQSSTLWFHQDPSAISGYETLQAIPANGPQQDNPVILPAGPAGPSLIDVPHATIPPLHGVTFIPTGNWVFNMYHYVSDATVPVTFTYSVFSRTTGGVETLQFSATSPSVTATIPTLYTTVHPVASNLPINQTDVIVIKVYATVAGGSGVTAHWIYDGATYPSFTTTSFATASAAPPSNNGLVYVNNGIFGSVTSTDGQAYVSNASGLPTAVTISGDSTINDTGVMKNVGIDGYVLPTLSDGYLNWTGTAWEYSAISMPSSLPPDGYAGGDLTGSYPNPTVAQISGASGNFNWLASTTNPSIIHLPQTTDTGATNLTINAQSAWTGSVANVLGGSLYLKAGNASDTAPGASISLSGASPRSVANASDIQFAADQYQFSSATNAAANTFILDPINAVFYANGISPLATLGKPGKYWNTTYTNSLYTNQITNTTAPTAGQFMLENATANGIAWTSLSGDVSASTSTIGKLTVNGIAGNTIPTPDGYSTSLVWNGRSFNWVSEGGSPLGIGLPATSNPNWNQSWLVSQWYIDPINGNDVYLGTSPDNALQTFQGLIAILGTISPVWTTPVTISYMNSVVSNDVIILTPILQEGASITFNCYNTSGPAIDPAYPSISGFIEPTVQHVVNVVSVVPKSRTVNGNQWQIVADTDLTGLVGITSNGSSSSAVGSMIHDLTNNSWFWLDSVVSGTGSSALLQLSQPMKKTSFAQIAANVSGAYAPDEVDTISAGDHLVVYTWPSVYLQSVSGTNSVPFGYTIGFQNLTLPATDDYINSGITFVECNLSSFYIYSTGYISLVNCTTSIAIGQGVQVNGGVIGTAECTSGGFGEITADALMSKYPYYTASDGYTFDGYSVSYIGGAGIFITSACANAEIGCGSQYEYPVSQSGFTINNKNYYSATYDGYGIIYGTGSIHLYNGAAVGVHAYGANITATNSIRLPSIVVDDYGSSIDRSVTPSQQYPYPSRAITPALIDASISSGGFGGFVYGNCGSTIAMFTPGNTPIVAVTPYLGTAGLDGYAVPTPSTNNTVLTYNSGALSWSPTSSGFTAAGDLSGNSSSQEVIGIDGYLLPPLSNGFLQWNGSAWAYSTPGSGFSAGGDLNGSSTSQTVVAIQGNPVSSTAPTAGQILVENAAATGSSWSSLSGDGYLSTSTPGHLTITGASGNFTVSGNLTVSGAETIVGSSTFQSNAVVDGYLKVATMSSGIVRSDGYGNLTSSNGTAGQFLVENAAATSSTWATISGDLTASPSVPGQLSLISRGLPGTYGNSTTFIGLTTDAQGRVTNVTTYSIPTSLTVGGDLYNTTANATVQKIQGQSFQSGTPTVGQFVVATYPSGTGYGHISITGDISSSATTAGKLTVTGIQGLSVTSAAPSSNQYLSYNGMSIVWSSLPTSFTVGGDLSGTTASATVAKLDGYTLPNPGAASSNTVLTWNGTALSWTSAGSSPTGTAGGDLAGTYPNPTLAVIGTGGTYGDPTHYATVTIDSKGRVTGASSQPLPSGGGAGKIVNVTAATTLSAPTTLITHVFLKAVASGGYTIVLPGVAASAGFIIQVKDCGGNVSSSNVVYIQAAEVGTTIDGITAGLGQTLYPFQATFGSMRFASDGVSWYIE